MRRLMGAAAIALIAMAPGCRVKHKAQAQPVDDGKQASVLNMNDPHAPQQLTRGFWGVENQTWRWTMKNFDLVLRSPAGSAQQGSRLQMRFSVPEAIYNRLGVVTVDAHIGGVDLGPETYTQAGDANYERDVPASALTADLVTVAFSVDKALPPSERDTRELALIVTTIGLLPK